MKTYLDMTEHKKQRLGQITPDKLTINQIIPTIEQSYLNGAQDMDEQWRNAIQQYCEENNLEFNKLWMPILNILNMNSLKPLES